MLAVGKCAEPGYIELITGSMWSGKSSACISRIRRHRAANRRCVILRYANDTRYHETKCSTHNRDMEDAVSVSRLSELPDSVFDAFDVIGVEEGQFFSDLVDFCDKHANMGRIVIVAALDSDANRKPFGSVCDLMAKAERVTKLSAVCMVCRTRDAPFTKRLVASDAVELIGGADLYEARCRGCWNAPIPVKIRAVADCSTPHVVATSKETIPGSSTPPQLKRQFSTESATSVGSSPESSLVYDDGDWSGCSSASQQ
jgi:thymidine kinase